MWVCLFFLKGVDKDMGALDSFWPDEVGQDQAAVAGLLYVGTSICMYVSVHKYRQSYTHIYLCIENIIYV